MDTILCCRTRQSSRWLGCRGLVAIWYESFSARKLSLTVFVGLMTLTIPAVLVNATGTSIVLVSLAMLGYTGVLANMLAMPADVFPSSVVASIWDTRAWGSGIGGMIFALLTGVDRRSLFLRTCIYWIWPDSAGSVAAYLDHCWARWYRFKRTPAGGAYFAYSALLGHTFLAGSPFNSYDGGNLSLIISLIKRISPFLRPTNGNVARSSSPAAGGTRSSFLLALCITLPAFCNTIDLSQYQKQEWQVEDGLPPKRTTRHYTGPRRQVADRDLRWCGFLRWSPLQSNSRRR